MELRYRKALLNLFTALTCSVALLMPVRAGCISDCRDEYDSEVDNCRNQYDDPDDADDLRRCIDNAKDEYDECTHECRS
jgi:hypothetical protein